MKKIPTLFMRDFDNNPQLVTNEVNPEAQWVFNGEGVATQKYDGTCCLVRGGLLYRRHELKPGKTAPANWEPANDPDPNTGKQMGWVPVGDGPEDKWFQAARREGAVFPYCRDGLIAEINLVIGPDGTYELVGPNIQGNPDSFDRHVLVHHASARRYDDCPRTFTELRDWLSDRDIEGVVFHHPDGRMAKIKGRDFGLKRKRVVPA